MLKLTFVTSIKESCTWVTLRKGWLSWKETLADSLDRLKAEKLRGRMVFFEGFAFGRMPSAAIRCVERAARSGESARGLPKSVTKQSIASVG